MAFIQYYPLSRVKTDLSTRGNQFTLNGKPYTGPYYMTFDGSCYTGANPVVGGNELLLPIQLKAPTNRSSALVSKTSTLNSVASFTAQSVANAQPQSPAVSLKQLIPYYPTVFESDYATGYFTRYFAKKVNMVGYIIEISQENWTDVLNNEDKTFEDYEVIDLFWQLTGPERDTRVSQYQIIGGVYDTNKRVTEGRAKGFNGLVEFIGGNYTKYARITK